MAEEKHIHIYPQDYWWVPITAVPWKTVAESTRQHIQQQQQNSHDKSERPKETWPEVVSLTIEEASKIIQQEKPGAEIEIVCPCYLIQQDLDLRRVRLAVDFSGKVQHSPTVG